LRTSLRKRANKVFNNYTKELDQDLYSHIHSLDLQPELVLLKWLRLIFSREFSQKALLYIWDYIFASISEEGREILHRCETNPESSEMVYRYEHYYLSHSDLLITLDYICVAMLVYLKPQLMGKEFIETIQLLMNQPQIQSHKEILELARRVEKLLFEKQKRSQT